MVVPTSSLRDHISRSWCDGVMVLSWMSFWTEHSVIWTERPIFTISSRSPCKVQARIVDFSRVTRIVAYEGSGRRRRKLAVKPTDEEIVRCDQLCSRGIIYNLPGKSGVVRRQLFRPWGILIVVHEDSIVAHQGVALRIC